MAADEVDFLELLIANERVLGWLEQIEKGPSAKCVRKSRGISF
jgi:hypothetical protein